MYDHHAWNESQRLLMRSEDEAPGQAALTYAAAQTWATLALVDRIEKLEELLDAGFVNIVRALEEK